MELQVGIIILNWNGTEDTIECIKSVKNNNYNNYTIVLVDNGSDKDSLSELNDWCLNNFSRIAFYDKEQAELGGNSKIEKDLENINSIDKLIFIKNNENLGFAAGNNVGLKYFLKRDITYAMLLNNDTVIEKDSITILMNFIVSHKEYVAVTPQIRYFEPDNIIWNCGGQITWFGNRRYYNAKKHISKVPQSGHKNITFITGCALLFKPNITGILTENFFFGEEDFDFSYRQKAIGRKMACCHSSVIYHKVNASAKKLERNIFGSIYLFYLSRLLTNKRYSSRFMYIIKVIVNLSYASFLLKIKYNATNKQVIHIFRKIIVESKKRNKIDKDYTLKYLKEDFV